MTNTIDIDSTVESSGIIPVFNPSNEEQIAEVPEQIRSFGHVKERHLKAARPKWAALMAQWRGGAAQQAA